jgi:DNA-binding protein HU-beta
MWVHLGTTVPFITPWKTTARGDAQTPYFAGFFGRRAGAAIASRGWRRRTARGEVGQQSQFPAVDFAFFGPYAVYTSASAGGEALHARNSSEEIMAAKKTAAAAGGGSKKTMSKSGLIQAISEAVGEELSRKQVKTVIESLINVGHRELKKAGVFTLPGFAKFRVVKKPATKARQGTNPFTKQPMTFAAKPASKAVRARPIKAIKDALA